MNHRENLLSLFRRCGYEYAPVQFNLCPSLVEGFKRRCNTGADYQDWFDFPMRGVCVDFFQQDFTDWRRFYAGIDFNDTVKFNCMGVALEREASSMHMHRSYPPMKNFTALRQMEEFPYPTVKAVNLAELQEQVEDIKARGLAAEAYHTSTIWEAAWSMRGMEELMMDMMSGAPMADYHLDKVTAWAVAAAELYARAGVDILWLGDDIGMQKSIMMSPELYRNFIKPRLAKVIKTAKVIKPDILIAYHSCGYIEPFIGDLIEAGVDILNPVQPECMDFQDIHKKYGEKLSFWGSIGTQQLMPFGTTEAVKQEVRRNLSIAGDKGGLLCTPTHLLEPEVPWENILAYVEACREFIK